MLYEIAAAKSRRGRTNAGGGLASIGAAVESPLPAAVELFPPLPS
jgi:hypothetical protein